MTQLKIDWCSHDAAKYAVEHWHYSRSLPSSKILKIGVWEDNLFIGAIIYGWGANKDLFTPYGLKQGEGCELCRVALNKHQTPVSKILSITIKMLKKQSPDLRLIVSFADTEQGHTGAIYQATNWIYTGMSDAANEYIVNGKRLHSRSVSSIYGTIKGKDFIKKIKGSRKHRYLYPLDKEMYNQVIHLSKPYPKKHAVEVNEVTL